MTAPPDAKVLAAVRRRLRTAGVEHPESAVTRYARALVLADRAYSEIPEDTLVGSTDRGGEKVHPAVRAWMDAERAAAEFGAALGLEPVRKQVGPGRPPGAVSARDRKQEPPRFTGLKAVK